MKGGRDMWLEFGFVVGVAVASLAVGFAQRAARRLYREKRACLEAELACAELALSNDIQARA